MSTLSYLRVQLRQAQRRLARYEARLTELRGIRDAEPHPVSIRRVLDAESDPSYLAAKAAAGNLTEALAREESRLFSDPGAKL